MYILNYDVISHSEYEYYKKLEKEVKKLQNKCNNLKDEISELRYENAAIKNGYLGTFEFAIVKDENKPYVDVWMDQHRVKRIRELALHQVVDEIPELIIKK